MVADLQNLGCRHAFRIRQIALHHHRITQRHSENHAQNTAGHTQQRCLPKREARPITGHQQTRQNKNNTGERTRGRSLSLHHIIFQNITAFKKLQNRHRNHRSRNRRRKSQAHLQAQIHIGCRKNHRNQRAEYHSPQRQFTETRIRINRLFHKNIPFQVNNRTGNFSDGLLIHPSGRLKNLSFAILINYPNTRKSPIYFHLPPNHKIISIQTFGAV